jgi:putative transposase
MGTAYRTLLLSYNMRLLPPETAEKVSAFLKVQEEFRRWAEEWLRGEAEKPERNPLKYFTDEFLHAGKALDWLHNVKNDAKPKRLRPPLVFNAQLRLDKERDVGRGVFVDIPKREVRIRKWSGERGKTIVLPLRDKAVEWILARVEEGGRLVLAAVWVGASRRSRAVRLYVALAFRREVAPMQPRRLLVVDFNALSNGVSWAVVEGERILKRGVLRPDVSKLIHLQKRIAELDTLCANKGKACEEATAAKSRLWRILRSFEVEVVKKLIQLALQYKAAIVADVPNDESIRELKENNYSAEKKVFLNFGRMRKRLKRLAEWYGVPYREERLYSTICPHCGAKMEEQPSRRVKCKVCSFETHRDEVPFYWAQKRFHELTSPFSKQIIKFCCLKNLMEIAAAPAGRGPSARRRLGRQARSGLAPGEAGRVAATPPRPARPRRTAQPGLQPPETAGS